MRPYQTSSGRQVVPPKVLCALWAPALASVAAQRVGSLAGRGPGADMLFHMICHNSQNKTQVFTR